METLIAKIKSYKANYIGKRFEDTELDDCCAVLLGREDGNNTDLHSCAIANENGAWIKFYVDTNPETGEIVAIDTTCVDYCLDSEHDFVDCVDMDTILA